MADAPNKSFFHFDHKVFGNFSTVIEAEFFEDARDELARSMGHETYAHTGFPADYMPEVVHPVLNAAGERVGFADTPRMASDVLGRSISKLIASLPKIKFEDDAWKPA